MSRVLSNLLGAKEPSFTMTLRSLEAASGAPAVDIRLSSDISSKITKKIRELGLSSKDVNGKELYYSLQKLIQKHDKFIVKAIGGTDPSDVQDLLPKIVATIEKLPLQKNCWAIKHSVAKRLLKNLPPKKIMNQLGYKSIDSMLKRENINELLGALRFAESPTWLKKFISTYKKLAPSDFESRQICIICLSNRRWSELSKEYVYKTHYNITHLKEMGVIAVLPLPLDRLRGICITLLSLILHYINEIRLYSAYFKLQQVKPNFGDIITKTLMEDCNEAVKLAKQPIHWRVIQRHYGSLDNNRLPDVFAPHIQSEDLEWHQVEDVLYRVEPALKFWENLDFVGVTYDGWPVSFNLIDNAICYTNNLPYGKQSVARLRNCLKDELYKRYLEQDMLKQQVIDQLDMEIEEIPEITEIQAIGPEGIL